MILSDNDLAHFAAQGVDKDALAFDSLVELFDVDDFTHFCSICYFFDILGFEVVFKQRCLAEIIAK